MGLLDALFDSGGYGGQGGGLLDFLRNTQMQQANYQPSAGFQQPASGRQFDSATFDPSTYAPNQAAPIAIGSYQMPRIGGADQFIPQQAAIPPNAQPTQGQLPEAAPQRVAPQPMQTPPAFMQPPSASGFGGAARGALANMQGGPLGMIAGALGGAMGMGRGNPQDVAQQNLKAQYDALVPALVQAGKTPQQAASLAMLAVMNPEAAKTLIPEALSNKEEFKTIKDGLGIEHPAFVNTRDQTINGKSIDEYSQGSGSSSGLGDMSKSGAEYLATLPKAQAGVVQGMIDGTIQPPSSFALAKPYWQGMLAAAKNADPTFDANNWATRHKMSTDMAASGNSSMGGILSNGKSAFAHLADLSGSMADLGNASHNFPGGGLIARGQNLVGNTLGGSDTNAKIKAISDNLGHYGQESTKFYSGTGGGVEERMNALKEMNPITTSSAEMAAYLEKEKSLMTDRLKQKEAQIRDTMGESYLQKHPIFTPDLRQTLDTIDANIAKLKGGSPSTASVLPSGWSVKVH